jgi:hypothetical protein
VAVPREEPEPVKRAKADRFTPVDQIKDRFADPGYRRYVLSQVRAHDVKAGDNFWGRTPMDVRRQLIQEAWLGPASGDVAR